MVLEYKIPNVMLQLHTQLLVPTSAVSCWARARLTLLWDTRIDNFGAAGGEGAGGGSGDGDEDSKSDCTGMIFFLFPDRDAVLSP